MVLFTTLQSLKHLLGHVFTGVSPEQEVAAAVLLHHLGPREARQFTEAIGAVDDGVAAVALGVSQQEVTVCSKRKVKKNVSKHHPVPEFTSRIIF